MKALLYKDFLLLWKQGRSFFLWAILLSVLSYRLLDGRLAVLNGMILLFFLLIFLLIFHENSPLLLS